MLVRITGDLSGTRNDVRWPRRGETIDLPSSEATDLCATGMAELVKPDASERAVATPVETRAPRKQKR